MAAGLRGYPKRAGCVERQSTRDEQEADLRRLPAIESYARVPDRRSRRPAICAHPNEGGRTMDQLVATPPGYPAELERAVTLRNGARVQIRPILPEDESRLIEFHERLSPDTAYRRFFTVMRTLPSELAHQDRKSVV